MNAGAGKAESEKTLSLPLIVSGRPVFAVPARTVSYFLFSRRYWFGVI